MLAGSIRLAAKVLQALNLIIAKSGPDPTSATVLVIVHQLVVLYECTLAQYHQASGLFLAA